MHLVQEPIRLGRPETFEKYSLQCPVEHIVSNEDILHGLISYPFRCPPSRIFQVIEDIGSPVIGFQKLDLYIDSNCYILVA